MEVSESKQNCPINDKYLGDLTKENKFPRHLANDHLPFLKSIRQNLDEIKLLSKINVYLFNLAFH